MKEDDYDDDRTQPFEVIANGTVVSHYKIISKIGIGGMGEVYLAQDTELERRIALKFLSSRLCQDQDCRARFRREAQAAARLSHQNVTHVYEVSQFKDRPYIAMELIEGETLADLIARDDHSFSDRLEIATQICDGLREAHNKEILHRDIKPTNILLDEKGIPHLSDFGLAKIKGLQKITKTGSTIGTTAYMSPEQIKGEAVDNRSDIFSLGVVLYELFTNHHPFAKETEAATHHAILNELPEPITRFKSNVPEGLQQIIDKALAKDGEMRYQHVDDLRTDIKRLSLIGKGKSTSSLSGKNNRQSARRRTMYVALLAVLLVIVLLNPSIRNPLLNSLGIYSIPTEKHLAVLPFINIGEDNPDTSLNDGLMEILTSKLNQLEQFHGTLHVIPASEVRLVNSRSAREVRKAFGATLAVTGSLRELENGLEMIINLIDAKKERQLRSSTINISNSQISSLHDSATFCLARMLELHLLPEDKNFLIEGGTPVPKAYYLYLEGMGFLQRSQKPECIDSAIRLFHQAIEEDDQYASGLAALGQAYLIKFQNQKESEWLEHARNYCEQAISINSKLSPVYVTLGQVYLENGLTQEAISEFENALTYDSFNHRAYREIAKAFVSLNQPDMAESTYKRAIELQPELISAQFSLGWFYVSQGRKQDALRQAQKIITLNPEGFQVWNNLGGIYYYLGQYRDARDKWNHSLAIEPNYGAFSNLGSLSYLEKQYTSAAKMYENALQLNDRDYQVWINLADVYSKLEGKRKDFEATLRRAISMAEKQKDLNPDNPNVLSHLAESYASLGENEKAIEHAERMLELAPDNVNSYVSAGFVYELVGERDLAIDWLGKALKQGCPYERISPLPELQDLLVDSNFIKVILSDSLDSSDKSNSESENN
jgi:serine/threonine protein kinase/tetratricopeptide (TPR) repeat protein